MRFVMTKKTKTQRELKSKAIKGELLPAFQLFQNYTLGQDVETDEVAAKTYFDQCFKYLNDGSITKEDGFKPTNKLTLETIELFDFRKFDHLKMNFENDLTVLIGSNGDGKTTILEAISKTLSWINTNIVKEDAPGHRISNLHDIKNDTKKEFSDIQSEFNFGKGLRRLSARLSRAKKGSKNKRDNQVKELKILADIWRVINAGKTINLPLMAFYSVKRSYPIKKPRNSGKQNFSLRQNRFDAYKDALEGAGKFEDFIDWYIGLYKRLGKTNNDDIESLDSDVKGLILSVESGIETLKPLLTQKQEQLKLLKEIHAVPDRMASDSKTIEVVNNVICDVVPSVNRIWMDSKSGTDTIMLVNDGVIVNLNQLSEGQRTFISLVSDLARRMILLNPKLDNPLTGQGIILIDEIELHLHPAWQQNILIKLQNAFPNIQFIVTTHSPQVLSTVDKRCIRQFVLNENGETVIQVPSFQTRGVKSSDILSRIMNTDAIPHVPEAEYVEQFSNLLLANDKPAAESLMRNKLIPHFGLDHPVILNCKNQIKIHDMKLRVKAAKNKNIL